MRAKNKIIDKYITERLFNKWNQNTRTTADVQYHIGI